MEYDMSRRVPRMIVALPRAVPIPLPLIAFGPTRLNLCIAITVSGQLNVIIACDSHWRVLQHVGDNEEPDHTSPDIYLI